MYIKSNTNKKKITIVSLVSALLLVGGVLTWYLVSSGARSEDRPENTVDYNLPSSEQKEAGDQAKQDFIDRVEGGASDPNQTGTKNPTNNVNITISSSNQNDQTYQIRTVIPVISDDGTCTLELTKEGANTITQVVDTQILGSYSVCKGFDISVDFMQKGTWQAKVSYEGDSGQGTAKKEIQIQ